LKKWVSHIKKTFVYKERNEEKRSLYKEKVITIPIAKQVYVDESGINTCLVREHGRSLRGSVVLDEKPGKKYARTNVIGAVCNGKHSAITCYKNKTNSSFFEEWFDKELLKNVPPGGTIILDNASFHRKEALENLIKKKRRKLALLFLPPYSPDLNPIEKSWANMKKHLRDAISHFESINDAVYNYFDDC
jgi:transposase